MRRARKEEEAKWKRKRKRRKRSRQRRFYDEYIDVRKWATEMEPYTGNTVKFLVGNKCDLDQSRVCTNYEQRAM